MFGDLLCFAQTTIFDGRETCLKRKPRKSRPLDNLFNTDDPALYRVQTRAPGPQGALPLSAEMLRDWPSGDLFGLSQNAGMGWPPQEMLGPRCSS